MRHSSEQFSEGTRSSERGNAIVEFVGVMAVLVVPAVIALLAVSALLMGQSALTAAARKVDDLRFAATRRFRPTVGLQSLQSPRAS